MEDLDELISLLCGFDLISDSVDKVYIYLSKLLWADAGGADVSRTSQLTDQEVMQRTTGKNDRK